MRHLLAYWQFTSTRKKIEAIALVSLLILGGLTLKSAARSNARSISMSPNEPEKVQATASARILQRQKQERQIRPENYDFEKFPVGAEHEQHWKHLLWTTAIVEPKQPFVVEALNRILAMTPRSGLTNAQIRTVDMAMKVANQLYLGDSAFYGALGQRFLDTIAQSPDPEWVAKSLSSLSKGGMQPSELQRLAEKAKARFPKWSSNIYLQTTLMDIANSVDAQSLPPLKDLLKWEVADNQLHLYALCRPDRRILCRAILKDRNGQWVRQEGKLWSVPLLLESIHGLSWNFTRGQTPQGIYRVESVVPKAEDEFFRAYGQFPLVNLFVPFEAGAKQFIPGNPGTFSGSLQQYQALLPSSWRAYRPLQQSFWAGKAGRSLFRIHGSGESADFFRGKDKNYPDSYNWNPTLGCLSAQELYSEKGQLLHADMPKILQALKMVGGKNFAGYLTVVDVPGDEKKPIAIETLETVVASRPTKKKNPLIREAMVKRSRPVRSLKPVSFEPDASESSSQSIAIAPDRSNRLSDSSGTTLSPTSQPLPTSISTEQVPLPIAY
ncbi:hypothetical protein JOY44_17705 [Phormidium sp. CLA17]|uniref:hypothetical protein n=1 Tax=Leptolyngbya sp. Cla-17 TaxID=2803751 RepID=UPI0014928693|nr:hypothetical protein [Leptolyngbya sp. Cla-17]MBM0743423.1 hypothetical protein [Leptolyngbya sp. Cla-17]